MSSQVKKLSLLFCAADRNGDVSIPNGSFVPLAGDKLYLVGQPDSLDQFFHLLGRNAPQVKQVFLVGGGKVSMYLAKLLSATGIRLKIVERSEDRCRLISERFMGQANRPVSSRQYDLLVDQQSVRSLGLDSVVSPKFITASHILHRVRGMQNSQGSVMNSLHRIADGAAEAMEFTVGPNTRHLGTPLKDLRLKSGVLLAVIVRGAQIIIPEGSSCLQEEDSVIIIARGGVILDLNDIYDDDTGFVVPTGGAEA